MRKGQLVVHSSPLTPFFGDEELSELQELAALADLAIARNELLDSQRTLAAIVQSSDDAIISRTLDGTITSWNRGAEKIYGYEADEAVGRSISMLDPHGYDDAEIMEKILRGESTDHYETERRTKERPVDPRLTHHLSDQGSRRHDLRRVRCRARRERASPTRRGARSRARGGRSRESRQERVPVADES